MRPIVFICPVTRLNVQHFAAESETSDERDRYESVECPACGGLHFVNVATGKVLGEKQG
jgi:hypothetical protein